MPSRDLIGFLPVAETLTFNGGSLTPVPEFADRLGALKGRVNRDGFLYSPTQWSVRATSAAEDAATEEIPGTRRPALIWKLAPSHEMLLDVTVGEADLRSRDGAFVLHVAAYLYGYRLQFDGWWFDGRVPVAQGTHHVVHLDDARTRFMNTAYGTWVQWPSREQRRFTNLLYMHSRAPAYEWDWESFVSEYMVTDALYQQCTTLFGVAAKSHADRIRAMCHHLGVWYESGLVGDITRLRRYLFHEGLWEGGSPGHSFSETAYERTQQLRCLNQRLIPAALGFQGAYVESSWADWRSLIGFE